MFAPPVPAVLTLTVLLQIPAATGDNTPEPEVILEPLNRPRPVTGSANIQHTMRKVV